MYIGNDYYKMNKFASHGMRLVVEHCHGNENYIFFSLPSVVRNDSTCMI